LGVSFGPLAAAVIGSPPRAEVYVRTLGLARQTGFGQEAPHRYDSRASIYTYISSRLRAGPLARDGGRRMRYT